MRSPEYILGALDVLVKAGEVSPAYAAGVADVLVKDAGLFWNTAAQNFHDNYQKWQQANPGKQLTPDEARQMGLDSRNWYDKAFSPNAGWGNYLSNRWSKHVGRHFSKLFAGDDDASLKYTPEYYDQELQDMENQRLKSYSDSHFSAAPEAAGAMQDAFVRDANIRYQNAKATMTPEEMEAAGIDEDYADRYRTTAGNAAIRGGAYKAKYDVKPQSPQKARYGEGLPDTYGGNKHLFYRTGYTHSFANRDAV